MTTCTEFHLFPPDSGPDAECRRCGKSKATSRMERVAARAVPAPRRPSSYLVDGIRFRCTSGSRYAMVRVYRPSDGKPSVIVDKRTSDLDKARKHGGIIVDLVTGEVVR